MVVKWDVGAMGERGGRVRSVSLINSYYHSREVRTSTSASTACTGSMVSVRVSNVCVCVCVCVCVKIEVNVCMGVSACVNVMGCERA